jgi:hypothetical protein
MGHAIAKEQWRVPVFERKQYIGSASDANQTTWRSSFIVFNVPADFQQNLVHFFKSIEPSAELYHAHKTTQMYARGFMLVPKLLLRD